MTQNPYLLQQLQNERLQTATQRQQGSSVTPGQKGSLMGGITGALGGGLSGALTGDMLGSAFGSMGGGFSSPTVAGSTLNKPIATGGFNLGNYGSMA